MDVTSIDALRGRDLLSLQALNREEFQQLLACALELKRGWKDGFRPQPLKHKTLAMIFEKQSLRTRTTFDIAMYQLGGQAILLNQDTIGLGVRESLRDIAHNLDRWVEGIMARTHSHDTLVELAVHATVPVINGLSDLFHPCQLLADHLTLREVFGDVEGLRVAFVGDGNNVCHSHINAAVHTGISLTIACPEGYEPEADVLEPARKKGADITIVRDPKAACRGADVLYTDVWISMGQEQETEKRRRAFSGYTVTPEWFDLLSDRGIFMHDLPAHYGEECSEEAVYHPQSHVFDQAENRLHAQKAVLLQLLGSSE
ncbi:MAG: ornithine carbamoyltransferase [Trueperaceae bacterium]|nr:MAG: ornithine carbamoyltransferase [Trueperaceae bacterium]